MSPQLTPAPRPCQRQCNPCQYPDAHGPGPPQRPHIPGSPACGTDFPDADSAPTANTLNTRVVFPDPQAGHFGFRSEVIER
jgi:hypothetical protein